MVFFAHSGLKLRRHLQHFFGACNAIYCVVSAGKTVQVTPKAFKKVFAAYNIAKKDVAATLKRNCFDFDSVFWQQKYVSTTKFGIILTGPIVCNTFAATKRNMWWWFLKKVYTYLKKRITIHWRKFIIMKTKNMDDEMELLKVA